jgi:hypothetical protein
VPAFKNLSGQKFGRLQVIERAPNQGNRTRWRVVCDCGTEKLVQANHLTSGRQVSCGCNRNEQSRKLGRNVKHGYFTAESIRRYGGRPKHLWYKYSLSIEKFQKLVDAQGGVCAICGQVPAPDQWVVDHDHACCNRSQTCGGCIRGLLCGPCNQGLGFFEDDAARLTAAATYVRLRS